jgi:methanogenic corrinoid protein MtbC1
LNIAPGAPARYRIGAVALEIGIPVETLRIWERRYRVVTPERSPRGGRLYSDLHVARLRRIKRLVDRGHAIGRVAPLEDAQLQALLDQTGGAAPAPADLAELRARFIAAIDRLDARDAQQLLGRAALLLGTRTLVLELVVPLLHEIGQRWEAGNVRVCHEHAASAIVRTVLGSLLVTQPPGSRSRTIVVGTPSGELHELGALMVALLAGTAGWDVLYLGPNLPPDEILLATRTAGAAALALSVVDARDGAELDRLRADFARLADGLPQAAALLIGGAGAAALGEVPRATRFGELHELDLWLRERGGLPHA